MGKPKGHPPHGPSIRTSAGTAPWPCCADSGGIGKHKAANATMAA